MTRRLTLTTILFVTVISTVNKAVAVG